MNMILEAGQMPFSTKRLKGMAKRSVVTCYQALGSHGEIDDK